MNTMRICSSCAKPLPPDAPAGLCPVCLLKTNLGTEPVAEIATPSPAEIARHFPHLEILELIGRGGMGIVYKGRQPKLDRIVALKILPVEIAHDAAFAERFSREAKALARLNHPNIVTVYDFGQSGAYYYFIMEFVDGMNLRQLIRAKTLEPRQALELVTQICTALQFAHDEKIVHRDIKPENLLITKKGQVKIADFGLAKLLGSQPDTALTASQMVMGTLNYMAPEQRENTKDVDHRADIYSLGVVFYEMLTGEVPMGRFDAPSKKVQIDVRLDEVVLHALEREPARRYQHVSEVKSNVETITSSMPRETPKTSPPSEPEQKMFFEQPIGMKHLALGWLGAGVLTAGVFIAINYLNLSPVFNLIMGALAVSVWVGLIYRQRVSDYQKHNARFVRGLLIQKFLMLAFAASMLVWCATLTEVFIAWLHRRIGSRAGNHDDVAVYLLLAAVFGWVVFEMVKMVKIWPTISPKKTQPAATASPSAPAPMPETEKVFSRSDAISIAKFILAIFICYVVGCFVPFVGLLMFCAVLLVGARQLSAQMKKASVPLPATPPPGFVSFVLKRFAIAGGAWLAVGLCLHWIFGDAAMSETSNGHVWSWSLGNWLVTFPPSVPVPLTYTILGMAASCFYLGFAGSVLSAIFILVTITWLEVRARCGLTPRQLPPSIRRRHRFWMGATIAGYAVVALTTTFLCNIFDDAHPFSMGEYQNVSDQATEFWFVPNSGAYQKLGFKAKFADSQGQVPANGVSTLPTCTLSLILHRTNAEPVVMKVILPGLRASYRFPATNNWDNTFVLDKDSLAAWFQAAGGVDLSVQKFHEEADEVYELLKAYENEPPVTVKEFVNLGKADLRDFYFGGLKGDSFTIQTVQSNGILFVALVIEGLIYLALHLGSTRRLYREALAEIQSGRWTPPTPPAKPQPTATHSPSAPATPPSNEKASPSSGSTAMPATPHPRLSRTAIMGAACFILLVGVIAFSLVFQLYKMPLSHDETHTVVQAQGRDYTSATHGVSGSPLSWRIEVMVSVVLGSVALLGMPICGWLAVTQIRRSSGTIYGLGLALFDGLFFALLLLDFFMFVFVGIGSAALGYWLNGPPRPNHVYGIGAVAGLFLTALISVPIDFFIVRKVWRFCSRNKS